MDTSGEWTPPDSREESLATNKNWKWPIHGIEKPKQHIEEFWITQDDFKKRLPASNKLQKSKGFQEKRCGQKVTTEKVTVEVNVD